MYMRICKNYKKHEERPEGWGGGKKHCKMSQKESYSKDSYFFYCKVLQNRHIEETKGVKEERVLGKEEISEKYSMLQKLAQRTDTELEVND